MFQSEYFKDKLILLLGLLLGLLGTFNMLWVVVRADTSQASSAIILYRVVDGVEEYDKQAPGQIYSFAAFAAVVMASAIFLSYKLYDKDKKAAYTVFVLSQLVIVFNIIISGAILNLQ